MEVEQVHERLTGICELFEQGEFRQCLDMSAELKRELLEDDDPADPLQLGWVRFYQFKSLYELGEHRRGYELLIDPEPEAFVVSAKNAAYMYSVGAEMAMHLGLADEVVRLGGMCLDLRVKGDDLISALQCASTVCELLRRLGEDRRNTRFARFLLELGIESGAERPLMLGMRCLGRNVAASGDADLREELERHLPALRAIDDDEFGPEVEDVIASLGEGGLGLF
jgi:hypothetical protein